MIAMRKLKNLALFAALTLFMIACAKDGLIKPNNVPDAVKQALSGRFAAASDIKWHKKDNIYKAEFEENNREIEVRIDENGQILEVETEIALSQLPAAVTTYISANYSGAEIEEAERVEVSSQTGETDVEIFYTVEIEREHEDEEQEIELTFDAAGNFLTETIESDDEHGGHCDDND
jgi:outer membrane lipoprotein-sorting protein